MSPQLAIICLQFLICIIALVAAFRGRKYMFGFVITFGIYLYYNLAAMYSWKGILLTSTYMPYVGLLAAVSALYAVWEARR